MRSALAGGVAALLLAATAHAQVERPDYRIRADFRDDQDNSFGNATVRVISRFLQVYYGGVTRKDEFRFQLSFDYPTYANRNLEFKVNDFSVGTLAVDSAGLLDVTYRSDWRPDDLPDLALPIGFPDPVDVGHTVSILDASTHELLLSSVFGEEFRRGDGDFDDDVDDDDLTIWSSHYGSSLLGPDNGDYSGDNHTGGDDFMTWQRSYTGASGGGGGGGGRGGNGIAALPEPSAWLLTVVAGAALAACSSQRRGR